MTSQTEAMSQTVEQKEADSSTIGNQMIELDERVDGTPLLRVEGTGDAVREMSVSKLEEDILNSQERGDDHAARSIEDVKSFLVDLNANEAAGKGVSLIGLASEKVDKLKDVLTADVMPPDLKASLEYKLATAQNGLNMLIGKSTNLINSRIAANRDPSLVGFSDTINEKKVLLAEVKSHNDRVQRNNKKRAELES